MKFLTTSCILAALSAVSVLADTDSSPTISSPSATIPTSVVTDSPHLELRQVGLVDPDAALTAVTGMGAVTNYMAGDVAVVYTQTFANVPQQWPSAKPGTIGMGDLAKRNLEAIPTMVEEARGVQTEYMMQPIVVRMVTEVVTIPVRRATSVVVVETVTMGYGNGTAGNGTVLGSNGTTVASMGFGSYRPPLTGTLR